MTNQYTSAFEPLRRAHDDVPVLTTGGRKTLPSGIGPGYPTGLPDGNIVRRYEDTPDLIGLDGEPTIPDRGNTKKGRRNKLAVAAATLALAATTAAVYVGIRASDNDHGPDVAPLVHQIYEDKMNHEPIHDPNTTPSLPQIPVDNP